MSKVWIGRAENGQQKFSEYVGANFREWLKENDGKEFRIEPVRKPVSANLRSYYFSAVIPVVRSTCDEWKDLTGEELHQVIKKLLFYFETFNPMAGRIERFGRSVMADSEWNNTTKAMEFLMVIQWYLTDCGREMPDSEEYKKWRDSAPLKGETYAPRNN